MHVLLWIMRVLLSYFEFIYRHSMPEATLDIADE